MQFKLFDILSAVIPGALVLCCLILTSNTGFLDLQLIENKIPVYKDVSAILTVIFIVASYLTGYIVHAVGSWVEPLLWKTWGGRPSQILLQDKSRRLGLGNEILAVLKWLKSKSDDPKLLTIENEKLTGDDFRRLFQIAKNLAFSKAGPNFIARMEEFNNGYVFSRNILIAFLIAFVCSIILLFYRVLSFKWSFFLLAIVFIIWWRTRDKAIYYSREILIAGYYEEKKKD